MRNVVTVSLAASAVLAGIAAVHAAPTQAQQEAIRSSCQSDYRSYCASVPTGGAEALQCLEKNVASLSSACRQAVKAASGGAAPASTQSGSATTSSGGGTAAKAPAPAASGGAASSAAKPPVVIVLEPGQEIALMRQACGRDYRSHCAGVRVVGGGALSCLVSHASSLSSGCRNVLSKLGQRF